MSKKRKKEKDLKEKLLEPEVLEAEDAQGKDLPLEVIEAEVLPADFIPEIEVEVEDDKETENKESLVKYDPLSAYLREISAYRPLSRDEEHALAVNYSKTKDVDAAYKLVTGNLWLVVKIAREYEKAARNLLDVIQEGNIGLMEAVKNFDPYKGVRFPSYASWWVKAYILRFILANLRLVKIGTTQAQRKLFFNLKKEKEKLESQGFYAEPKLLAEKLNVKESEVIEMQQRLGASEVSVDAPVKSDSDLDYLSILPSGEASVEDMLEKLEAQMLISNGIKEFIKTLTEKEATIFNERLLGEEKVTLQDLAEKYLISKERIRQIENRLKERFKEFLIEKFGSNLNDIGL